MLDALVGHLPEILELMTNGGENNGSESKVGILMGFLKIFFLNEGRKKFQTNFAGKGFYDWFLL